MLNVEYKFKLGNDEFTLRADVQGQKEFFQAISFYQKLPKVGPNGETDLVLQYKVVQDYEFYSIVSEQAGQEYKFGQFKDGSGLFGKGWEPLYQGEGEEAQAETRPAPQPRTQRQAPAAAPKTSKPPVTARQQPPVEQEPEQEALEGEVEETQASPAPAPRTAPKAPPAAQKQAAPAGAAPKAGGRSINDIMNRYSKPTNGGTTAPRRG